jgi:protein SCO1/2
MTPQGLIATGGTAVLVVGVAIFAATRLLTPSDDGLSACRSTAVAGAGAIGGPFELTSETGARVTERDVIDGPALIYFGYTFCPDVCPVDAARNADAATILTEDYGLAVKPVFISVDPRRDTPDVLADFTDALHPEMLGLTGSPEDVDRVVRAYKAYASVPAEPEDEYYLVDHSAFTYLMLPEIRFAEVYRREVTPAEMAESLACYIREAA